MNREATIMTIAILTAATCAARDGQRIVAVCMDTMPTSQVVRAEAQATAMFAAIGVKLDWRCSKSHPQTTIVVSIEAVAPENRKAGELAYALPYEGTHIVVFYDRVRKQSPNHVAAVLAHVLVHEMTHILQGLPHHSERGVMKAQWDAGDYSQMASKPLPFTDDDIDLVQRGLDARAARRTPVIVKDHMQ
jgi:hypothetical protein